MYVDIKDDAEVMEGVDKMHGLGDAIYQKGKAEGKAEGLAEGIAEGKMEMIVCFVKDGLLSISDASKRANMSEAEFMRLIECDEKDISVIRQNKK